MPFVALEDILDKLPLTLLTPRGEKNKIFAITLHFAMIKFYTEHPFPSVSMTVFNTREDAGGRGKLLFEIPEDEIQDVPLYTTKYLEPFDTTVPDIRPLLEEVHGVLKKIFYTETETEEFYRKSRKRKKQDGIKKFLARLDELEEELRIFGTYAAVRLEKPYILGSESQHEEFKTLCSEEEYQYYMKLLEAKKHVCYSSEERAHFVKEKTITEAITTLNEKIDLFVESACDKDLYLTPVYNFHENDIERCYTTLLHYQCYEEVASYRRTFDALLGKFYFT